MRSITIIRPDERLRWQIPSTDSVIFYRRLDSRTSAAMRRANTTTKVVKRQVREVVDDDALSAAVLDHVILDWENVRDATGASVPCTPASKSMLPADVIADLMDLATATTADQEVQDAVKPLPAASSVAS